MYSGPSYPLGPQFVFLRCLVSCRGLKTLNISEIVIDDKLFLLCHYWGKGGGKVTSIRQLFSWKTSYCFRNSYFSSSLFCQSVIFCCKNQKATFWKIATTVIYNTVKHYWYDPTSEVKSMFSEEPERAQRLIQDVSAWWHISQSSPHTYIPVLT